LLKYLLNSDDHRARAAAVRVLSFWLDQVASPLELLAARVNDPHPRVRLEAVRALSFLQGDEVIEVALGALEHDVDEYLQYTLDETMRVLEQ
jgi:HEAT repeat protein